MSGAARIVTAALAALAAAAAAEESRGPLDRALELRVTGKLEEALAELALAERDPGATLEVQAEAILQRALILEAQGRYEEAEAAFDRAARGAPRAGTAPHALLGRGRALARLSRHEEAARTYRMLQVAYPRFGAAALLALGRMEAEAGRVVQAAGAYRELMRGFPGATEAAPARRELRALCERVLASGADAGDLDSVLARGGCLLDEERHEEAAALYEREVRRRRPDEERAALLAALAGCYASAGRPQLAIRAYRRAGRLQRGSAAEIEMRMAIVQVHFDRQRLGDAVRELGRVVKDFEGTDQALQARYMMGSCYEELGDPGRAERVYRRLLDEAPASPWGSQARQRLVQLMERRR